MCVLAQCGMYRQRKHLLRPPLSNGHRGFHVRPQRRVLGDERPPSEAGGLHPIGAAWLPPPKGGGLLSDETRIVDCGTDGRLFEMRNENVPPTRPDGVLVAYLFDSTG